MALAVEPLIPGTIPVEGILRKVDCSLVGAKRAGISPALSVQKTQ
jgi:hypothetical protein